MTEVSKQRDTIYTFIGLSQFHSHGSWLVCEVALIPWTHMRCSCKSKSTLFMLLYESAIYISMFTTLLVIYT
jgi:hypothetical protein